MSKCKPQLDSDRIVEIKVLAKPKDGEPSGLASVDSAKPQISKK